VWPPFPVERTPCRFWVLLVLALLLMVWRRSAGSKRPTHFASRRTRLALGLALVLTSLLVGCGGGGEGGGGGGNPGTPGGTYSLSITGTTTSDGQLERVAISGVAQSYFSPRKITLRYASIPRFGYRTGHWA
jgi:hypothetical protein